MTSKTLQYSVVLALLAMPLTSLAQKVEPVLVPGSVVTANKYTITMGQIVFKAAPKWSGRINSIKYGANEVLNQDSTGGGASQSTNFGSTFWPTPQNSWESTCRTSYPGTSCFPPPIALDGNTDSVAITPDSSLAFTTPTGDTYTKLRFGKKYWGNLTDSSINIQYTMYNTSASLPDTFGPWEDTRIPGGGVYLFPSGTDTTTGANATLTKDSLGVTWFNYDSATVLKSGTDKFYAMSGPQGWYAHIDKNGVLFIKSFQGEVYPSSERPPLQTMEKQIELYTSNQSTPPSDAGKLCEMELQGPYLPIPPLDSTVWNEKWFVRQVSPSIMTSVDYGSPVGAVGNDSIIILIAKVTNTTPPTTTAISQFSITPAVFSSMDYTNGNVILNLEKTADISLSLVNSQGQVINRLHSGLLSEGHYTFSMNSNVPKGIYYLVLKSSDLRAFSTKMIVRF